MRTINAARLVLVVAAATAVAFPSFAQVAEKPASGTAAPASASKSAPAKKSQADRRLDFVPTGAAKAGAVEQSTAPAANPSKPSSFKDGSHCHAKGSDA